MSTNTLQIDEQTIYDATTGICYTKGEGWNFMQTREEARESGEIWTVIYVGSVNQPSKSIQLSFEKEAAERLWKYLIANSKKLF